MLRFESLLFSDVNYTVLYSAKKHQEAVLKTFIIVIQRFYVIYKAFKMFPKCLEGVFLVQNKTKSCLLALGSDTESVQTGASHLNICKMKLLSASNYPGKPEKVSVGKIFWYSPAGFHAS